MDLSRVINKRIGVLGLSALVACASPEPKESQEETPYIPPKAPEIQYIFGRVTGENLQGSFANPNRYIFSLQTPDSSIKLVTCVGDYPSSQMNALVNQGSNIKLRLNLKHRRADSEFAKPSDKEFYLCKENLVEIDGVKADFSK